jgi:hypothetical protein
VTLRGMWQMPEPPRPTRPSADAWSCREATDGKHVDEPADDLNDGQAHAAFVPVAALCGSVVAVPV